MFVLGLIVGPTLGVVGGDYLRRKLGLGRRSLGAITVLALLLVLLLPAADLELKLGLLVGLLLGLLLALTPIQSAEAPEQAPDAGA
ncbi:MAG TPA: hypothetical protein VKX16_01230 [Chloroflexota bacterium]|nr:hypothetical protein [Chloroflexota bacterium]